MSVSSWLTISNTLKNYCYFTCVQLWLFLRLEILVKHCCLNNPPFYIIKKFFFYLFCFVAKSFWVKEVEHCLLPSGHWLTFKMLIVNGIFQFHKGRRFACFIQALNWVEMLGVTQIGKVLMMRYASLVSALWFVNLLYHISMNGLLNLKVFWIEIINLRLHLEIW